MRQGSTDRGHAWPGGMRIGLGRVWIVLLLFWSAPVMAPHARAAIPIVQEWYQYNQARAAFNDGLYGLAEVRFERFLSNFPESQRRQQVLLLLGQARLFRSDESGSLEALDAGVAMGTRDGVYQELLLWRGRARVQAGQFETALEDFRQLWQDYSGSRDAYLAHLQAAKAWYSRKEWDRVVGQVDEMLRHPPEDMELLSSAELLRARAWLQMGELVWAERELRRLVREAASDDWAPSVWLARVLMNRGMYAEARTILRRVVRDSARDEPAVEAWLALAELEIRSGTEPNDAMRQEVRGHLAQSLARTGLDRDLGREALLQAVDLAMQVGLGNDAKDWLVGWLDQNPGDGARDQVLYRLSEIYLEMGELEKSASSFRSVSLVPGTQLRRHALMGLGRAQFLQAKYADAMNSFRLILSELTEDHRELKAEASLRFAEASLSNGSFQEAIDVLNGFSRQFQGDPRCGEAAFRLGEALEAGARDAAAVDAFVSAAALQEAPVEVRARAAFRAGLLQLKMRRLDDVHETMDRVSALGGPADLVRQARLVRSRAYELAEDWQDSLGLLRTLVAENAMPAELQKQARFRHAWALQMLGRVDEARMEFTAFVDAESSGTYVYQALFWLGQDCFGRGDFAAARQWFERLGHQAAGSDEALACEGLYWAARSAQRLQLWRDSISSFQLVVDRGPSVARSADARFGQGESATEMGEFALASDFFKDLIQRWPDHELVGAAWGRMGDCFWTLKDNNRALECYREAERLSAGDEFLLAQALFKQGRTLEALGQTQEALDLYTRVVYDATLAGGPDGEGEMAPANRLTLIQDPYWVSRCAFSAGDMLERQGEYMQAIRMYRRVVQLGGSAADEANRRLRRWNQRVDVAEATNTANMAGVN